MTTTTRYAIELEPGKYANGNTVVSFKEAKMYAWDNVEYVLSTWFHRFPLARIIPVRCKAVDNTKENQ